MENVGVTVAKITWAMSGRGVGLSKRINNILELFQDEPALRYDYTFAPFERSSGSVLYLARDVWTPDVRSLTRNYINEDFSKLLNDLNVTEIIVLKDLLFIPIYNDLYNTHEYSNTLIDTLMEERYTLARAIRACELELKERTTPFAIRLYQASSDPLADPILGARVVYKDLIPPSTEQDGLIIYPTVESGEEMRGIRNKANQARKMEETFLRNKFNRIAVDF